jgi:ubiquinone/menaquinone biosynthesis C-methylase UbiE
MARDVFAFHHQAELKENKQLTGFVVQNLNKDYKLPFDDNEFDVVTCVVSVDYLIRPLEVFKEVQRVLRPGGKFIVSQSNRCFATKAISVNPAITKTLNAAS